MTTLLAIAITWYLTKIYYTRSLSINPERIEDGIVRVVCIKCSKISVVSEANIRTPFYCTMCH